MRRVALLLPLLVCSSMPLLGAPSPSWPSLQEQLQKDKVKPGSSLEKLIRDHQDFRKLRLEEAVDGLNLPPWLRVLWREAHPEGTYSVQSPSGGYPLILKETHAWLITHQDLLPGARPADIPPGKLASIRPDLRISGLQGAPRSESDIRVNYSNPSRIIAASNDIETSGVLAQFYSSDGGTTWGQTSLPLVSPDQFQGDPTVDWTSDGTAWAMTLGISNNGTRVEIRSYKSLTQGATWIFDGTVSGGRTDTDKEMLWVDHSVTSPFRDYLYVVWASGPHMFFNRRTGPSGSWAVPIELNGSTNFNNFPGADVKSNAPGDVFAFWPVQVPGTSDQRIIMNKSTDGGQTFSNPITVTHTFGLYQIRLPAIIYRKALIYASAAAYRTAAKNLVYASWTDLTGDPGCSTQADASITSVTSSGKTRVWFARSTDDGVTWSAPLMINNQATLNDQFAQHLAVDETTGTLAITYYDTASDPGRIKTDVWYQSSYDDGASWTPPLKVTRASTDETSSGADLGNQYGDYNGLSGYAGTFFPTWTDRRSNAHEEIWTASVSDTPSTLPTFDTVGNGKYSAGSKIKVKLEGFGRFPSPTLYGATGEAITGDWNGDGIDTIGGYDQATATFKLRNSNTDGTADLTFAFGPAGSGLKAVTGDWNGDGVDTPGLWDPSTGIFLLRNSNTTGGADITFTFTGAGSTWPPIAGDWNGDGIHSVGLYDPATSTFYLRNSNTTGGADISFVFGTPGVGLLPNAGDWNGDGRDSIGVYNPVTLFHQLRDSNSAGPPDYQFNFGNDAKDKPVAGKWKP